MSPYYEMRACINDFSVSRDKNEVPLSFKSLVGAFEWFWFTIFEHQVRSPKLLYKLSF